MQGRRIPILCQEQGLVRRTATDLVHECIGGAGGEWHTTNIAVPQYHVIVSILCLENTTYSVF